MTKSYNLSKHNVVLSFGNYFEKPACLQTSAAKKMNVVKAMLIVFCFVSSATAFGQGVFTSAATGDWNVVGSWTLSSGTDADGIPDADDNVTIGSTNIITVSSATTVECNNLTVAGSSATSLTMAGANSIVNIYGSLSATAAPSAGNYIDCTADVTAKAVFKRTTSGDLITGTWGTFGEKVRVEVDLGSSIIGTLTVPVKFRELIVKSGTLSSTGEIRPDEGTTNTGKVTIEDGATILTTAIFSRTGTANVPFASLTINGTGKIIFNGSIVNSLPTVAGGFPIYTFSGGAQIEYQGGAQTIADINYPNLVINATGAKTFNTTTNSVSRTVAGNVIVSANRLGITASTLYPVIVNGNITVSGTTSNLLMNGGDLICNGNLTLSASAGTVSAPTLWSQSTFARVMGGSAQGAGIFTVQSGSVVRNIFSGTTAASNTQNPVTTQFPNWQTLDLQTGSTWVYAIPSGANGTRYQDVQDTYNGNTILYKTLVLSYLNNSAGNINTTITNPSIATALSADITAAAAPVIVSQNITFANTNSLTIPSFTTSQLTAAITSNQNITLGAQPLIVTGNVSITNPTTTQTGTSTIVTLNAGSLTIGGTLTLGSTTASMTLNNPYISLNNAASSLTVIGNTILRSSQQTNGNIRFANSGQTVTFNGAFSTANGNATAEIFNFNGFNPTVNFNGNFADGAVGTTFFVTGTEVPVINFNNGTSGTPATSTLANLRGAVTVNGYRQISSGNFRTSNSTAAAYSMNVVGTLDLGANTSVATNSGGGANTLNGSGTIKFTGSYASQISGYSANNFQGTGTLHFAGTILQTIPVGTYANIIVDNAAGVNLGGNTTVNNALTLTNGTLSTAANTLTLKGATSGSGLIDTGASGTLVYNGAVAQTVSNLTANTANILTIDNLVGVTLGTDTTVNNDLTINAGSTATILSGKNVTVNNAVISNGSFVVQNNANLIQNPATVVNSNSGAITVNRSSSPLLRLDYTLWSSPVASQNLAAFSPLTSLAPSRFYTFNTTFNTGGVNGAYAVITDPTVATFSAGAGYLIRMPNTADAVTPTAYAGQFTGIPNNGDVPVTLVDGAAAGLRYNLVGNPYPSTISMQKFVFDNTTNIENTLWFWRKTNGAGTAYCTWQAGLLVTDPGTFVTNGNTQTVNPLGIIQTAQGFFVEAKSGATSLTFKNSQRVADNAGQFFKTKQVAELSKLWLNATNAAGDFSQMAVTYFEGATIGLDAFDGKYINDSAFALTSNVNNGEYTIQGRPAFDVADVVALNFKTELAGEYTIAIDHSEGIFASGQDIYLVDSKTGTETNLKTSSYNFTAASGVDNARFSLKYQKTLKVVASNFNENSVMVYAKNGTLYVNSGEMAINSIEVYDVQGRLIAERKNVNATTATLENLKANNQVLLVKVLGENNQVVTKKVVN